MTVEVIRSAKSIANPQFRKYAQMYLDIERDFQQSVLQFGLPFATVDPAQRNRRFNETASRLAAKGVDVANDRKSFSVNWISPACVTCRLGEGTETFLSSTQCPRNCFFCFNANQVDYAYYQTHVHDMAGELEERHKQGVCYTDLAVTGGEPLLHKRETLAFFQKAQQLYPDAYTRLYTSGYDLDEDYAKELKAAGLNEIRFSIKLEEPQASIDHTLELIEHCTGIFEAVMVEMPVMPDQTAQMEQLVLKLDQIGATGINLLELCFPLENASEFKKRGYAIKPAPYRVLYDYWYAGGLPIAGSEEACLDVLEYAVDHRVKMGVHYCSLENKFTGQIYQQNKGAALRFPQYAVSPRDHFLKIAKAFGKDAAKAKNFLAGRGRTRLMDDPDYECVEFPLAYLSDLQLVYPDMEIGIGYAVQEMREGEPVMRELCVRKTTPASFDRKTDL